MAAIKHDRKLSPIVGTPKVCLPSKSIEDKAFEWVPHLATDIRATFERARSTQKPPSPNVKPLRKKQG